ncbi:hypothetical protein OQA88_7543 [Cercophora sp. LCS_1]
MEHAACHVIYVDRVVSHDRHIASSAAGEIRTWEAPHIAENVGLLLDVFGEVHLVSTGGACLTLWLNLQDTSMVDMKPTIILFDTPYQDPIPERSRSRSPSPHSPPEEDGKNHEEELYGLELLQRIMSESYVRNLSKLVVPVPVITFPRLSSPNVGNISSDVHEEITNAKLHPGSSQNRRSVNRRMLKKCLDMGATDVMANPMNSKCMTNLEVHVYRAHREAAKDQKAMLEMRRGRKRSWVGISDEKPYAYLRETMVSTLMNRICRIDSGNDAVDMVRIGISPSRHDAIAKAVGAWHFCAHSFTDDELIHAAAVMFRHALAVPELEQWRIPTDQLHGFLIACRAAYNDFVPYHNFRHVVDVLQATFHFLISIGALPPYQQQNNNATPAKSPIAKLLGPFEALVLLITAVGHDVGHPGVNNGFLVTLNAPLAQLYNDRSVLESFHCAAFSQILRRYWGSVFSTSKIRSLMISSILATDMQLHFNYMEKLFDLQKKLAENGGTAGWDTRAIEEQRSLACALLIKCADISNVARRHDTAVKWMHVLAEEFSRQAEMETELDIPTALASPPKKDALSLAKSQLGFMNLFAVPLFDGVADILPSLRYCADELRINLDLFDVSVDIEEAKAVKAASPKLPQQDGVAPSVPANAPLSTDPPVDAGSVVLELSLPTETTETAPSPKSKDSASQETVQAVRLSDGLEVSTAYRETNGIATAFDAVSEFERSDPFNINNDVNMQCPTKQRCSETTEGSSVPYSGDWASQATSATTGKMPLSPSTQGTSMASRDSMDRPNSVPVTTITAPESTTTVPESAKSQTELKTQQYPHSLAGADELESVSSNGNGCHLNGGGGGSPRGKRGLHPPSTEDGQQNGRTLKKKGSRFRINPLPFIRRHLSSSPPLHATDTAG